MDLEMGNFEVVSNQSSIQIIRQAAQPLIGEGDLINEAWIRSHGWVAVPVEMGREEFAVQIGRICRAAKEAECEWCWGCPIEPHPIEAPDFDYFRIPMTFEGMNSFMRRRLMHRYLVVPPNRHFAVLMSEDVYVVAGTLTFTIAAIGVDLTIARAHFQEAVARWRGYNEHARKYFNELDRYYLQFR